MKELCKLQSWCGPHFLNDPDLAQMLAARAEEGAKAVADYLALATVAASVGDRAREADWVSRALNAAVSSNEHISIAAYPTITVDTMQAHRQLIAALEAAENAGDLRDALDHPSATSDMLPKVVERLRSARTDTAFWATPWNALDVLRVAAEKGFVDQAAVETEILSLLDESPLLSDRTASADERFEGMHLLDLARSAAGDALRGLREELLVRAQAVARNPSDKHAIYAFMSAEWNDPARADAYLQQERAAIQPFLDEEDRVEAEQTLMDTICQCAMLVAMGDGTLSVQEKQAIENNRPMVEMMYRNRDAIALLESTADIEQARAARASTVLVYSMSSGWLFGESRYSRELNEQLEAVTSITEFDALCRMYAARIKEPFARRLALLTAMLVSSADAIEPGEFRVLMLMAEVWNIELAENQRFFNAFVYPLLKDDGAPPA
ncbi:MAG: hypothetical protein ACKOBM_05390 [Gammaproteobacteria bacterium]